MSIVDNKISCIKRMIDMDSHMEMFDWLKESKIIPDDSFSNNSNQLIAEIVYYNLTRSCKDDKIQLLDFEWSLLPKEYIKITIITEREKKEFTYNL